MSLAMLAPDDSRIAATVLVLPAEAGQDLPLDRVFGLSRDRERRAAELAHPTIRADHHGDPAHVFGLLRAAYDEALAHGVDEIYLVGDQPLLTLLRGYGFRFRAVAGPMWANASWSIAAVLSVDGIVPGLRLHQAVHGCRAADVFSDFDDAMAGPEICARRAS
ncbi:MAG: hypothetical protein QOG53_1277 [Frankiales bacterium]|jgi:hypothetical protein|nr:hypothetical protein [Frankiales bacterium]